MKRVPRRALLATLSVLFGSACVLYVAVGAVPIAPFDLFHLLLSGPALGDSASVEELVLWSLRLPRLLAAILVGCALALAGATQQSVFRNPLADPGLLGVSAGAALFAAIFLVGAGPAATGGWFGTFGLTLAAFTGGLLATGSSWLLGQTPGGTLQPSRLLLAGIAVNALAMAGLGLVIFLADDAQIRAISFWNLGSLGNASWSTLAVLIPGALVPALLLPRIALGLNLLQLGEDESACLGIDPVRLRCYGIVLATVAVGTAVAVSGVIGFVGLVVPHLVRLVAGADHRVVLPASALLGGTLVVVADLISRTVVAPAELPIGIVTALCGAPFFAMLLRRRGWSRA